MEDLERNPVGEMATLHDRLGLANFAEFRPKLERYVESLAEYRKNEFPALDAPMRRRVAAAWQRSFETWKYPL